MEGSTIEQRRWARRAGWRPAVIATKSLANSSSSSDRFIKRPGHPESVHQPKRADSFSGKCGRIAGAVQKEFLESHSVIDIVPLGKFDQFETQAEGALTRGSRDRVRAPCDILE
jgi:hypothetical protein